MLFKVVLTVFVFSEVIREAARPGVLHIASECSSLELIVSGGPIRLHLFCKDKTEQFPSRPLNSQAVTAGKIYQHL